MQAKWRFSSILKLPWRPRLAAAGATTYVFDEQTGLVVQHIEEWDVEAQKVIHSAVDDLPRPYDVIQRYFASMSLLIHTAIHMPRSSSSC